MSLAVLIPALKPSASLVEVIDALVVDERVEKVIVVNDGSPADYDAVFQAAAARPKVTVLRHAVNLGKGAGLRMGINHFLCTASESCCLVTADADGQHLPKDILAVGARAEAEPSALVLGSRVFNDGVPLRSRFGNEVTRFIFRTLIGGKISDTQTGLRAIPRALMPTLLRLKTTGYEFELEMLILAAQKKIPTVGVEIETVYLDGNASSHFNPLLDSMRIYFVFARFLSSAFFTAVIDYLAFSAVYHFSHSISGGIFAGRLLAGTVNFAINKNYVFHMRSALLRALVRYASLVAVLGCIAYVMIDFLVRHNGWNAYIAKVTVEGLLLMASFVLQREVVFTDKAFSPATEVTDWDAYYAQPFALAHFTRRITGRLLEKLIKRFSIGAGPLKIMELGGANSCFHDQLTAALRPACYDVADNNQQGVEAFRQTVGQNPNSTAHALDVLSPEVQKLAGLYDVCFSVGLVEHFDPAGTARSIASHFTMLRPGGLAIITYPTPTLLYRATRFVAESTGQWILWDERPLRASEIMQDVLPHGEVLHTQINWWIVLTQGVVVVRKPLDDKNSAP